MRMTFRWYGEGNDSVTLKQIKQIPGVEGVVWALHDIPAGEVWPLDRILKVKEKAEEYNLHTNVVESVNVHEDIKLGLPSREQYIDNYVQTIQNLGKAGVEVICYNFMPVFDWIRSDLFKPLEDDSTALFYEKEKIEKINPIDMVDKIANGAEGYTIPGWDTKRLSNLKVLFRAYNNVYEENLWENLDYFLKKIIPAAEDNNIKMAIHPDDPPWSVFGLPRIITCRENIRRLLKLVDSPANGLTLCSGSLGSNLKNDVAEMIGEFSGRIPFAHIRNVRIRENGDFIETSHRTCDGSLDIYGIVKAYHEIGFNGYARPDHGRHIWDEKCRPGYGLYDRAMGIMYLWGIWDSLERQKKGV